MHFKVTNKILHHLIKSYNYYEHKMFVHARLKKFHTKWFLKCFKKITTKT